MFHHHGRTAVFMTLLFFTFANLNCGGGGGGGDSDGGDDTDSEFDASDPTNAYPSELAAASSSIFAAETASQSLSRSARQESTDLPPINIHDKIEQMNEILKCEGIACCANFTENIKFDANKDVECYGPSIPFVKNGSSSNLPGGDLGIWEETEGDEGEACAAAKVNSFFTNTSATVDLITAQTASILCVAKNTDNDLPAQGETLDLTEVADNSIAEAESEFDIDIPVDPNSVTVTQLEPTSEGNPVYEISAETTLSLASMMEGGGEQPPALTRQSQGSQCTNTTQCTSPLVCIIPAGQTIGGCGPSTGGTTGGTACTSNTSCPSGLTCVTQNGQAASATNPGGCSSQQGGSSTGTTTGGTTGGTACTSNTSCPSGQTCKTQNGQPASVSNPGGCISEQSGGSSTGTTTGGTTTGGTTGGTTGEPPPGWGTGEGGQTGPTGGFDTSGEMTTQFIVTHVPLTASTYRGCAKFRMVSGAAGGFNCGTAGENTRIMAIRYAKTSASDLKLITTTATFCGDVSIDDAVTADCKVDFIKKYVTDSSSCSGEEVNAVGWGDDATRAIANINPETGLGKMTYAWQAGRCDQHVRCFEAETTATGGSDGGAGGVAYFGYGVDISDLTDTSCLDGIICAWTGPEAEAFGSKTILPLVQRQGMTLDETAGVYTSDADRLNIAYTPALDCDSTGATYTCDDGTACPGDPDDDLLTYDNAVGTGISVTEPD